MAKKISSVFKGSFTHTQGFGENPANYARFGLKGHNGDDYGMPVGTSIYAPFNGRVIEKGSDSDGYGNYLKLWDPSQSLQIIVAHLNSSSVNGGQNITTGQMIAGSGNTGNSSGPHLHVAAGDTDGSGNRLNRGNGYDGWYSWLNLDRSGAPASSGTTTGISGSGEPSLIDEGGAPTNPTIIKPNDREAFYGVVPTIEVSAVSAVGGEKVEYNIHVSPGPGDGWRGWSTSRTWKPLLTNFDSVNYSVGAAARVFKDGIPRESPDTGGITFVLHPDIPPPSAREPEGYWVASSQSEFDSGVPGIYVKYGDTVLRTVNSITSIQHEIPFGGSNVLQYGSRGDYYASVFEGGGYNGRVVGKIEIGQSFTTGFLVAANSFIVARQKPAITPPSQPPAPPAEPPVDTSLESRVANLERRVSLLEGAPGAQSTTQFGQTGLFYISSEPAKASIYIDGKFLADYTPTNIQYQLTVGKHLITLKKKGYKDYSESVDITQGMLYSKVVKLETA